MKHYILYRIARPIIKIYMNFVYKIKVINSKIIPEKDKCILVGNHTSNLDALLLMSSTNRTIRFMAKKELHKGLFKCLFLNAGTIPVDRSKQNKNAIEEAKKALISNEIVCIFPEGTINKTHNTLLPFKYGSVSIAKKTDSPIIPFVIKRKYKIFKKSVTIEFLEPIYINNNLEEENKKLYNIIQKKLEEKDE